MSEGLKIMQMPLREVMVQLAPSAAVLMCALLLMFSGKRDIRLMAMITAAVVAEIIALLFYNGPRTTWPAVLYSLLAILYFLRHFSLKHNRVRVAAACL